MLDKELLEQFQIIMENMATKSDIQNLREEIRASETRINIKIENEVTKRIDSLFDGYKLTHEKQYDLERRMEKLELLVAELQSRIA